MSSGPTVPERPTAAAPLRDFPTVPTEVLRLARQRVRRGEHLEMSSRAAELGVNRVILHRWAGSRERLLVEMLWSLAEERSQLPD